MSVTQALPVSAEMQALRLVAQVASALVRPLAHLDPTACRLAPLSETAVQALAVHPAFRLPLERALSRSLGLGRAKIDDSFLARLRSSARTRVCALVASQPLPLVREAAVQVGAAILHRQVVGKILKSERERLRSVFGDGGFQVATQEAMLLHAPLAELDTGVAGPGVLDDTVDPAVARERLAGFGLQALARFVERVEPALIDVVLHRIPPTGDAAARARTIGRMSDGHCDHMVKLLRRRVQAWSAPIG